MCVHICCSAHTSLLDASAPRMRNPRLMSHPKLAAAKVTSQPSTSPFKIFPSLLSLKGPNTPRPHSSWLVCKTTLRKFQLSRPHTHNPAMFEPPALLGLSSSPRSQISSFCRWCFRHWGAGAFPKAKPCRDKGPLASPQDDIPAPQSG